MTARVLQDRDSDARRIFTPPEQPPERRNRDRVEVTIGVTVRERQWRGQAAKLLDLSPTGCRICDVPLTTGQRLWVTIAGLAAIEATATWHRAGETGIRFAVPLHPAVFDHLVAENRHRPLWG